MGKSKPNRTKSMEEIKMTEKQKKFLKGIIPFLKTKQGQEYLKTFNATLEEYNDEFDIKFNGRIENLILEGEARLETSNALRGSEALLEIFLSKARSDIQKYVNDINEYWAENGLFELIDEDLEAEKYFNYIEKSNFSYQKKIDFIKEILIEPERETTPSNHLFSKDMRFSELSGACKFFDSGFAGLKDFLEKNPTFKATKEVFTALDKEFENIRIAEFKEKNKNAETYEKQCFADVSEEIFKERVDFYTENRIFSLLNKSKEDETEHIKITNKYCDSSAPVVFLLGEVIDKQNGEKYVIFNNSFIVKGEMENIFYRLEENPIVYQIENYQVTQSFLAEDGYISCTDEREEDVEGYYDSEKIPEIVRETLEKYYEGEINIDKNGNLELEENNIQYRR